MKTIYLLTHGTILHRNGERLLLEKDKKRLFEIPLKEVGRLMIYSRCEISHPTIQALLDRGIALYYVNHAGRMRGKITPPVTGNVFLRKQQHEQHNNPAFCLSLARHFLTAKLHNMEQVLRHLLHHAQGTAEALQPFPQAREQLLSCTRSEEMMGVEGAAARHYFSLYGQQFIEPFRFTTRSRPAQDPANALLNFGYMNLTREVQSHLEARNLDPDLGLLHATQNGRPSLALDLIEEFRQPFIDLFVLRLFNRHQLSEEQFHRTENGIQLSDQGLRKFCLLYEEHIGTQDGLEPGFRQVIDQQAARLVRCIAHEAPYESFHLEEAETLSETIVSRVNSQ